MSCIPTFIKMNISDLSGRWQWQEHPTNSLINTLLFKIQRPLIGWEERDASIKGSWRWKIHETPAPVRNLSHWKPFSQNWAWPSTLRQTGTSISHGSLHGHVFPEQHQDPTCATCKVRRTSETVRCIKSFTQKHIWFQYFKCHPLTWLWCCFQVCSYVFGEKVWQQFGEAQVCSWRVSSERHTHLRSSGEGRVFHHPQKSFTFLWRLLQIFPWHPASFSWSHRRCSSVMLWRMNITWGSRTKCTITQTILLRTTEHKALKKTYLFLILPL